jgi:hypothetical protein
LGLLPMSPSEPASGTGRLHRRGPRTGPSGWPSEPEVGSPLDVAIRTRKRDRSTPPSGPANGSFRHRTHKEPGPFLGSGSTHRRREECPDSVRVHPAGEPAGGGERSRDPRWRTTTESERSPGGSSGTPVTAAGPGGPGPCLRRLPPVRAESGGLAPLPEHPATANHRKCFPESGRP